MRIISGEKRGFRLARIKRGLIRPTSDRTKELIFNVLRDQVKNSVVLDIFAGSGSLGIEALSRGALRAIFIDNNQQAIKILLKNLTMTQFQDRAEILNNLATKALRRLAHSKSQFSVIFADPPYKTSLAEETLNTIDTSSFLVKDGWFILEHHFKQRFPKTKHLTLETVKQQGETSVSFFRHAKR
ncbi:MAG: 16S rRNA (guanine(966)-N(2))-methyltransferase RsmD [bacterium]